jgi:hypothetical protein
VFLSKRHLIIGLAVCAIVQLAALKTRRITAAQPDVPVAIEGSFQRDGQYPGAPFANAVGVRAWGSWSGSDDNVGSLTIGPFRAPSVLRFGAGGYPNNPGNILQVELAGTSNRRGI